MDRAMLPHAQSTIALYAAQGRMPGVNDALMLKTLGRVHRPDIRLIAQTCTAMAMVGAVSRTPPSMHGFVDRT